MGMGIDDNIGNGKEWETTCMGMGMAIIPIGINSHRRIQCAGQETKAGWLQWPVWPGGHEAGAQWAIRVCQHEDCEGRIDMVEFWKENRALLPQLFKVARRDVCVPASSSASERVFSTAGRLLEKRRTNLSPDSTNSLLFLHSNMQTWDFCFWWQLWLKTISVTFYANQRSKLP